MRLPAFALILVIASLPLILCHILLVRQHRRQFRVTEETYRMRYVDFGSDPRLIAVRLRSESGEEAHIVAPNPRWYGRMCELYERDLGLDDYVELMMDCRDKSLEVPDGFYADVVENERLAPTFPEFDTARNRGNLQLMRTYLSSREMIRPYIWYLFDPAVLPPRLRDDPQRIAALFRVFLELGHLPYLDSSTGRWEISIVYRRLVVEDYYPAALMFLLLFFGLSSTYAGRCRRRRGRERTLASAA